MYRSLFLDLKPLVYNGESGVLKINYEYGHQANIYLKEGLVAGIVMEGKTGLEAVKICTRWVSISTHFSKKNKALPENIKSVDTSSFLSLLEKVDIHINKINKIVPGNDTLFKIDISKLDDQGQISSQELKIMLLLDGSRSVEQVVSESELSEIEVLAVICKLSMLGVATVLTTYKPMKKDQSESFLKSLADTLGELVGPIADMLISEAFENIDSAPEILSQEEIPQMIETICINLEEEEKMALQKWCNRYLQDNPSS